MPSRIDAERRVLQFLCQGTPEGNLLAGRSLLGDYTWGEPLHRVLFEAILDLPMASPEVLQVRLPAVLTRKGYPDVDLNPFFQPHGLTQTEAKALIRKLKESLKGD